MSTAQKVNRRTRTFTLTMDTTKVPLIVTQKSLDDFEVQGLAVMDELLMQLTERMAPANEPATPPTPLNVVGRMLMDGATTGNAQKMILCVLWLAHHYPSIIGMNIHGYIFRFSGLDDRYANTTLQS